MSENLPGSLRERIAREIRQDGPIPFSRYMELCLYEPELGYYSRAREQFGKAGDFYTSSDVHAVFGRLLARQFEEMWRALDSPARIDLIELGPGRGLFARDVLDWSAKRFPEFFRALRYQLIEQSPHLREKLRERLGEHIEAGKCEMFGAIDEVGFDVSRPLAKSGPKDGAPSVEGDPLILFANEFFDALPVEVIDHRGALRIGFENGRFAEIFVEPSAAELEFLDRYGVHPEEGERVEVCWAALDWMGHIVRLFEGRRGFVVVIDYGYTREEQLAGRHRDTIMTYRQHVASASPYEAPGEQDITAHVNLTALRARAEERGLKPLALLTQSQFLIGIGEETEFADAFPGPPASAPFALAGVEECRLPPERAKVALQLKHLISPSGMGETFQVLLLSHDVGEARLSGMKLGR